MASGVFAHLYSQSVTIVIQLASLPIFLLRWNADLYGQWLIISAIPIYLSIADFGILNAAANMMTMHRARGEIDAVKLVFNNTLFIVLMVLPSIAAIAGAALFLVTFRSLDQREALFALILSSLLTVASGLFDAAYRPFGKYPRVVTLLTSARISEWVGSLIGLFVGGTLKSVAIGFFIGRALSFVLIYVLARHDIPELKWNLAGVNRELVLRLLRMGAGFISFTVGSLLTLQGMILMVGAQLGGVAVAIFSASRTLTRLLAQISILTGKSLAPEISALHGAANHREAAKLSRQMAWSVMFVTTVGALLMARYGHAIWSIWSRGKLPFNQPVFALLLVSAICTAYWQIQSIRLTATNRHQLLALVFLGASILSLLGGYLGMPHFGLIAAATSALGAEIAMVGGSTLLLRLADNRAKLTRIETT